MMPDLGPLWFMGFPKKKCKNQLSYGINTVEALGLQEYDWNAYGKQRNFVRRGVWFCTEKTLETDTMRFH